MIKPEISRLPQEVVLGFIEHADELSSSSNARLALLAVAAGGFIAVGAAISLVISLGVESPGLSRLLLGVGFSTGFMLVIISGTALITEVNVVLPEMMLARQRLRTLRYPRFWIIVLGGNVIGTVLIAALLEFGEVIGPAESERLGELVREKMRFMDMGTRGWFAVAASGVAGNWLVGMAAFLAMAARTIPGKMMGVLFPVVGFVALGVQHAPANLGYFSLAKWHGEIDFTWVELIAWNLLPAIIGNVIGATTLVAALFWFTFGRTRSEIEVDKE